MKKTVLSVEQLKCPVCHSKNIMFRKTDATHWCRKCGTEFLWELTKDNKPVIKPKPKVKVEVKAKSTKKRSTKPKAKKQTKKH